MQDVVVHACCLINLAAEGEILKPAPLPTLPWPYHTIRPQLAPATQPMQTLEYRLHIPLRVSQQQALHRWARTIRAS